MVKGLTCDCQNVSSRRYEHFTETKTQEARVTEKQFALGKRSKESQERDVEIGTGTMLTKVRPRMEKM